MIFRSKLSKNQKKIGNSFNIDVCKKAIKHQKIRLENFLKKVFLFGQLFRVAIRYLVNYQSRLQGCHFLLL